MNEDFTSENTSEHQELSNGLFRKYTVSRSETVQEIITKKPGFLEKWALYIFAIILLLLLVITWCIKYPETIEATAWLSARNAPKEIITLQEGRLVRLFVRNEEYVKAGQSIGWLESIGDHSEILDLAARLDSSIKSLMAGDITTASRTMNHSYTTIGELQGAYQQFAVTMQQVNDYFITGFYRHKKSLLRSDIRNLENTSRSLSHQRELTAQDIQLAQQTFDMNDSLSMQHIIPREEFRVQKSKFLNKKMSIDQIDVSLFSNESQKKDKEKELNQLDHDFAQQKLVFLQALSNLRSEVNDWVRKYVLLSPIDGKVVFTLPVQQNQFLPKNKLIAYINPAGSQYYAQVTIPQGNSGKVDTGLTVRLRFDAYPYQETGVVKGTLDYVSRIASDSGFLATVRLDQGLVTDLHYTIQYKDGLKAHALVITRNMRLLQRLYYNMVKITTPGK